ncbi:MAG: ACT domain-containing protein [Anaerolineales bacterium]|nr:ACT domain-containing protein [Anaerolineales bacterium]MDW8277182.1 ACT domain-containing protein [Anaerolineales bacterium]
MKPLKFSILEGPFTIHRLKPGASIPKGVTSSPFYSISGSVEELSIVAPEKITIESEQSEPGWSVLKVVGPLPFEETGILAGITALLAAAGIPLFAISTFETDYILVKHTQLKAAKSALTAAGHKFARPARVDEKATAPLNAASYALLLEKQIPLIKSLLVEKIGPAALATLRSEAALAAAVGGLYEFLPTAIRLVVNRDVFVSYCVRNLDRILPEIPIPAKKPAAQRR